MLEEKWSLDACYGYAVKHKLFPATAIVCVKTLYNYVDSALLKLRNINLPLKVRLPGKRRQMRENLKNLGRSIDERPATVDRRENFGHWEIDTVIGSKTKQDSVVLTLLERLTRKYIAIKIVGKTTDAVADGLLYLFLPIVIESL